MFEAILTLCLMGAEPVCRERLLPGYAAARAAGCRAALADNPPDLAGLAEGLEVSGPVCRAAGEALEMAEVAPGVFAHLGQVAEPDAANRGDVSNLGFVIGEEGVAVIDTGSAPWMGEALWRAIRTRTDLPVTDVILTHMHPDHVFGSGVFMEMGARVWGHAGLVRALADRQANYLESLRVLVGEAEFVGVRVPGVTDPVAERAEIDLGGRVLDLRAWPVAHTGNDLTVLDRESGTLFSGDLVFDRHTPALDGSLRGWRAVLEDMQAMAVARVIPGHGGPSLDWPMGAHPLARYLKALERDTRAAIDQGARLSEAVEVVARGEAGAWQLFDAYNPRNATVAYTELEWE
ncbi:MAG: quinoprotein relay system zinc metallohydrolase 2 [Roseovarius sp.]|jgi:quinoprotein relay system zinc metallohydrolase 2|uniref:quinoprotein relay system zinc metallohydrolase 2 n=1 Tax=Roseovarius sp. TaxID=1486281 RepID=UPI0032EC61D1